MIIISAGRNLDSASPAPLHPGYAGSDSLKTLQAKMQEYIDNGALLGWLIDTKERKVYVYRPGTAFCCLDDPETLSGDPVLPGFVLDLRKIWA